MHFRILFFLVIVGYQIYPFVKYLLPFKEVPDNLLHKRKFKHLVKDVHRICLEHNTYYRKLSKKGRQKFISRLLHLIQKKEFVGYHDLEIDFEMKVVVLSAHVQLTYGFNRFSLPMFKRYILYPEQFYSRYFDSNLKGLTGRGFVTLSWKDTLHGFQEEDDNLNLAIHEISHAVVINFQKHGKDDFLISNMFAQKQDEILAHFIRLGELRHQHTYLRDYAFTNENEFIAVCIEHFFETPMEFQSRLPNLYSNLVNLLRQNPLNVTNDYKV